MSESIVKEITAVGPQPIVIDGSLANHWFWKFVPVDPLVFNGPMHDGSATQIARQVYHRMLGRIVAENAHGMQVGLITAAWLVTIFLGETRAFRGGGRVGLFFGLAAFGAFLFFAVPVLMRLACPSSASDETRSIVSRAFLRELPPDTPADRAGIFAMRCRTGGSPSTAGRSRPKSLPRMVAPPKRRGDRSGGW